MSVNRERAPLDLRARLRIALASAIKDRDVSAVSALRGALAAIDNAEAVEGALPDGELSGSIAGALSGVGAGDIPRRQLSEREIIDVVRQEIHEHRVAADAFDALGQHAAAAQARGEAEVLAREVPDR